MVHLEGFGARPAYLWLMQVRKIGQKKPPEGLDGLISGVSGLGELDFGFVEGSEVAQGLRFVSI